MASALKIKSNNYVWCPRNLKWGKLLTKEGETTHLTQSVHATQPYPATWHLRLNERLDLVKHWQPLAILLLRTFVCRRGSWLECAAWRSGHRFARHTMDTRRTLMPVLCRRVPDTR